MRATMSGDEHARFMNDSWDDDCDLYLDAAERTINGVPFDPESGDFDLFVKPNDVVGIVSGSIRRNSDPRYRVDLVPFFLDRRAAQSSETFVVVVDESGRDEFLALLAERFPTRATVRDFGRATDPATDSGNGMGR